MEEKKFEFDERAPYAYFQNTACPYFPCHAKANRELYALGDKCGGNFVYTENGVKDCSNCLVPHSKGGYPYIMENFHKISELAKRK